MANQMETLETSDTQYALSRLNVHYPSGPLLQRTNRYKVSIGNEGETREIYDLAECHSHSLRIKTALTHRKLLENYTEKLSTRVIPLIDGITNLDIKCSTNAAQDVQQMLQHLKEMPKENIEEDINKHYTEVVHISVFHCGRSAPDPFLVTVGAPKDPRIKQNEEVDNNRHILRRLIMYIKFCGAFELALRAHDETSTSDNPGVYVGLVNFTAEIDALLAIHKKGQTVELVDEMFSIMRDNKQVLTSGSKRRRFRSLAEKSDYLSKRSKIEDRLKFLVKDMQELWLKQWRCLFTGKITNVKITRKSRVILNCLVKHFNIMKPNEIKAVLRYCFPQGIDKSVVQQMVLAIKKLNENIVCSSDDLKKHPDLDAFPWEMMDVLKDEVVTRVPSFRFAYNLYKAHKADKYFIVFYLKGSYIINPDKDLDNMEIRITTFLNYWLPNWTGISGRQPEPEEFLKNLTSADVFLRFYALDNKDNQGVFLQGLLTVANIQRRRPRVQEGNKSKAHVFKYFVYKGSAKIEVCLNAFTSVFAVTRSRVRRPKDLAILGKSPKDLRGKNPSVNKLSEHGRTAVRQHIESFPVKISHYSNKEFKYLSSELNLKIMYNLFKEQNPDINVSYPYYTRYFRENFSLRFGRPQIDVCATCQTLNNKIKDQHLNETAKRTAVAELMVHKRRSNKLYLKLKNESMRDANVLALASDFMQNIQLPKTPVGDVFYYQQLTVSIFCIHNLKDNKAKMYIYHEGEAKKPEMKSAHFF
nr:unnamed protein product [Callosobruchus analis]